MFQSFGTLNMVYVRVSWDQFRCRQYFIFDLLSGHTNPHAQMNLNAPARRLRVQTFLKPNLRRTNYGQSELMTNLSNRFERYAQFVCCSLK